MQSGIKIHDSVIEAFNEMKLLSPKSNKRRRKFLRLCMSDDNQYIIVDDKSDSVQETNEDDYLNLLNHLQPNVACVLIYDVSYETKNSLTKEDLVFIQWCPEKAPLKQKMQFTTTVNSLKNKLKGIKANFQLNCLDDISRSELAEKLGDDVVKVEGVAV
ncbi:cofilin-2-like [Cetorhinus maximus]